MRFLLIAGSLFVAFSGNLWAVPLPWYESEGGNGHYYELTVPPSGISWTEAQQTAAKHQLLGTAGHLVAIGDEAEWEFVTRNFPHIGTWIGLTDKDAEGQFKWVTGEPMSFSFWKSDEPNNADDRDFVYYELGRTGWGWSDLEDRRNLYSVDMPLGYLVEYPFQGPVGDFVADGVLDAQDIDRLTAVTVSEAYEPLLDLNADGVLDYADRKAWVEQAMGTVFGDANLDGRFDSGDFVDVFIAGEYEDGFAANSSWAEGDWNGDLDFGTGDLVAAFQSGAYQRTATGASSVPEPGAAVLLLTGWLLLHQVARTRWRV